MEMQMAVLVKEARTLATVAVVVLAIEEMALVPV